MSIKENVKQKIDKLPENIVSEVYDFIMFLESKKDKNLLIKHTQELSIASFSKIWDNEEDSIYDNL